VRAIQAVQLRWPSSTAAQAGPRRLLGRLYAKL